MLNNSTAIQKLIVGNATSETIQDQATKEGMDTMQVDGLIKALSVSSMLVSALRALSTRQLAWYPSLLWWLGLE